MSKAQILANMIKAGQLKVEDIDEADRDAYNQFAKTAGLPTVKSLAPLPAQGFSSVRPEAPQPVIAPITALSQALLSGRKSPSAPSIRGGYEPIEGPHIKPPQQSLTPAYDARGKVNPTAVSNSIRFNRPLEITPPEPVEIKPVNTLAAQGANIRVGAPVSVITLSPTQAARQIVKGASKVPFTLDPNVKLQGADTMTPEEKFQYEDTWSSQGAVAAHKYYLSILPQLRSREAVSAGFLQGNVGVGNTQSSQGRMEVGQTAREFLDKHIGYGAPEPLVDASKTAEISADDAYMQGVNQKNAEAGGGVQFAGNAIAAVTNMVPTIATGFAAGTLAAAALPEVAAAGGTAAGVAAVSKIGKIIGWVNKYRNVSKATKLGQQAGSLVFAHQTFGQYSHQSELEQIEKYGYSDVDKQVIGAAINTAGEVALEKILVLNNLFKIGDDGIRRTFTKSLSNNYKQVIKDMLKTVTGEALQEGAMDPWQAVTDNAVFGADKKVWDWNQIAYDAALGALVGAGMGSAGHAMDLASVKKAADDMEVFQTVTLPHILETADQDSLSYNIAKNLVDSGKDATMAERRGLVDAFQQESIATPQTEDSVLVKTYESLLEDESLTPEARKGLEEEVQRVTDRLNGAEGTKAPEGKPAYRILQKPDGGHMVQFETKIDEAEFARIKKALGGSYSGSADAINVGPAGNADPVNRIMAAIGYQHDGLVPITNTAEAKTTKEQWVQTLHQPKVAPEVHAETTVPSGRKAADIDMLEPHHRQAYEDATKMGLVQELEERLYRGQSHFEIAKAMKGRLPKGKAMDFIGAFEGAMNGLNAAAVQNAPIRLQGYGAIINVTENDSHVTFTDSKGIERTVPVGIYNTLKWKQELKDEDQAQIEKQGAEVVTALDQYQQDIVELMKELGTEVVFYKGGELANNGFYGRDGKTVYININANTMKGQDGKDFGRRVVFHEFLHTLEDNDPVLYGQLVDAYMAKVKPEAIEKYRTKVLRNAKGYEDDRLVVMEMLSDEFGNVASMEEFWLALREENKGLFESLVSKLRAFFAKLRKLVGEGSRWETFLDEEFMDELEGQFKVLVTRARERHLAGEVSKGGLEGVVRDSLRVQEDRYWSHSTPHVFDSIDHSYMGSGEGAQLFGWGTYVASNANVESHYRDRRFGKAISYKRQTLVRTGRQGSVDDKLDFSLFKGELTPMEKEVLTEIHKRITERYVGKPEEAKEAFYSLIRNAEADFKKYRKALEKHTEELEAANKKVAYTQRAIDAIANGKVNTPDGLKRLAGALEEKDVYINNEDIDMAMEDLQTWSLPEVEKAQELAQMYVSSAQSAVENAARELQLLEAYNQMAPDIAGVQTLKLDFEFDDEHLLDWDEPLEAQSDFVKGKLLELARERAERAQAGEESERVDLLKKVTPKVDTSIAVSYNGEKVELEKDYQGDYEVVNGEALKLNHSGVLTLQFVLDLAARRGSLASAIGEARAMRISELETAEKSLESMTSRVENGTLTEEALEPYKRSVIGRKFELEKFNRIAEGLKEEERAKETLTETGGEYYTRLWKKTLKSDKEASLFLLSLGIKGHRFLDAYSRKGRGDNTYNLVVYDDKAIKVVDRYSTRQRPYGAGVRRDLDELPKDFNPDEFLQWDKSLRLQTAHVKETLEAQVELLNDLQFTVNLYKDKVALAEGQAKKDYQAYLDEAEDELIFLQANMPLTRGVLLHGQEYTDWNWPETNLTDEEEEALFRILAMLNEYPEESLAQVLKRTKAFLKKGNQYLTPEVLKSELDAFPKISKLVRDTKTFNWGMSGGEFYQFLVDNNNYGNQEKASWELRSLGIPGHVYKKDDGTLKAVVYDAEAVPSNYDAPEEPVGFHYKGHTYYDGVEIGSTGRSLTDAETLLVERTALYQTDGMGRSLKGSVERAILSFEDDVDTAKTEEEKTFYQDILNEVKDKGYAAVFKDMSAPKEKSWHGAEEIEVRRHEAGSQVARDAIALSRFFGTNVKIYDQKTLKSGEELSGGFAHRNDPTEIHLRGDITDERSDLVWKIVGHELFHTLRARDRVLYRDYIDFLKRNLDPSVAEKYVRERWGDDYVDKLDLDETYEELGANELGRSFTSPEFWWSIREFSEKLFNKFMELLDWMFYGPRQYTYSVSPYTQEVVDRLEKAWNKEVVKVLAARSHHHAAPKTGKVIDLNGYSDWQKVLPKDLYEDLKEPLAKTDFKEEDLLGDMTWGDLRYYLNWESKVVLVKHGYTGYMDGRFNELEYAQLWAEDAGIRLSDDSGIVENDGAFLVDANRMSVRQVEENKEDIKEQLLKSLTREQTEAVLQQLMNVVDTVNSDPDRLDYEPDQRFSAIKPNSDKIYIVSLDFSTICKKRYALQAALDQAQKKKGRYLGSSEIQAIRQALDDAKVTVSCGVCYVDSRRMLMGDTVNDFLGYNYATETLDIDQFRKNLTHEMRKKDFSEAKMVPPEEQARIAEIQGDRKRNQLEDDELAAIREIQYRYYPELSADQKRQIDDVNPEQLLTSEGVFKMAETHPEVYKVYSNVVRKVKAKGLENRTEYVPGALQKHEKMTEGNIAKLNQNAGMRWQSWSDFEVPHMIDAMLAIIDMADMGLKGHAYTKVKEFVEFIGRTGMMVNMSLIPEGVTGLVGAKAVFSSIEGMDPKVAKDLRDEFKDTAGTIAIGINDEQILAMMVDPFVDYIIPYHRSGLGMEMARFVKGLAVWWDYEKVQGEKALAGKDDPDATKEKAPLLLDWWDPQATADENTVNYILCCTERGLKPKFWGQVSKAISKDRRAAINRAKKAEPENAEAIERALSSPIKMNLLLNVAPETFRVETLVGKKFKDWKPADKKRARAELTKLVRPGAWKLLVDRKMFNQETGAYIQQQPVQPVFDDKTNSRIMLEYGGEHVRLPEQDQKVVDEVVSKYIDGTLDMTARHSARTTAFDEWFGDSNVTVDGRPGSEPKIVYHGTPSKHPFTGEPTDEFFEFEVGKGYGAIFFADKVSTIKSQEYGDRIISAYLRGTLFDVDNDEHLRTLEKKLKPLAEKSGYADADLFSELMDDIEAGHYDIIEEGFVQEAIKAAGFDGFTTYEGDGKNYAVFSPTQIKSATENVGTYDPKNPDIRYSLAYHAGDLGKAEKLARMTPGRGTGHFGTGTYFVGDKEAINLGGYKERPQHAVELDGYRLFKPGSEKDAQALHDALKFVNDNWQDPDNLNDFDGLIKLREAIDRDPEAAESLILAFEPLGQEYLDYQKYILGEDYGQYLSEAAQEDFGYALDNEVYLLNSRNPLWSVAKSMQKQEYRLDGFKKDLRVLGISFEEAIKMMRDIRDEIHAEVGKNWFYNDEARNADSASTRLMKQLGWQGVDVRSINSFDNTQYGSVVYDLTPEERNSIRRPDRFANETFGKGVDADNSASPEELVNRILDENMDHEVYTDEQALKDAHRWIDKVGRDTVLRDFILEEDVELDKKQMVAAQIILKQAVAAGDDLLTVRIVKAISEKARTKGQAIQALAMWANLSPEGIIVRANQVISGSRSKKENAEIARIAAETQKKLREINLNAIQGMDFGDFLAKLSSMTHEEITVERLLLALRTPVKLKGKTAGGLFENVGGALRIGAKVKIPGTDKVGTVLEHNKETKSYKLDVDGEIFWTSPSKRQSIRGAEEKFLDFSGAELEMAALDAEWERLPKLRARKEKDPEVKAAQEAAKATKEAEKEAAKAARAAEKEAEKAVREADKAQTAEAKTAAKAARAAEKEAQRLEREAIKAAEKAEREKAERMLADYIAAMAEEEKAAKPVDPVRVMVNTLYQVAKKYMPDKPGRPKPSPEELVAMAIRDRAEYERVWQEAKAILEEELSPEALEALEPYLDSKYREGTSIERNVGRAIKDNLKEMEVRIRDTVKEFYGPDNLSKDLVSTLVQKSGLTDAEAEIMASEIVRQVQALTKAEKLKALERIFAKKASTSRKEDLADHEIAQIVNLGALDTWLYKHDLPKVLAPKIRKAIKEADLDLAALVQKGLEDQALSVATLTNNLLTGIGAHRPLSRSEVTALARFIYGEVEAQLAKKRQNRLKQIFPAAKRDKATQRYVGDRLLEITNLGGFDDVDLHEAVAERLGLSHISASLQQSLREQAEAISRMEEGYDKTLAVATMLDTIAKEIPPTAWEKINTIRTMAMLLNPVTVVRNIVGNSVFGALDLGLVTRLASLIDPTHNLHNAKVRQAAKEGWLEGKRRADIETALGVHVADINRYDLPKGRTFREGVLGQANELLDKALRGWDMKAYYKHYNASLMEQMLLAKVDSPTEEMVDNANALALYRTFQDDTAFANVFTGIKSALNFRPGGDGKGEKGLQKWTGGDFGIGSLLLPFVKTPANLAMRALDYSPAGFILTLGRLHYDTTSSPYMRSKMKAMGFSRAIVGTGFVGMGMAMAALGLITGGGDDDKEFTTDLGLGKYRVNVTGITRFLSGGYTGPEVRPGDLTVRYDWLQPMSVSFAMGADIWDKFLTAPEGSNPFAELLMLAESTWQSNVSVLTEQGMMSSMAKLFGADPGKGMLRLVFGSISSFVPSFLTRVGNAVDSTVRDTKGGSLAEDGLRKAVSKIPGAAWMLPADVNPFGQDRKYYDPDREGAVASFAQRVSQLINPAIWDIYQPTDTEQYVMDLYQMSNNKAVIPDKLYEMSRIATDPIGKRYGVTSEQYQAAFKASGPELDKALRQLLSAGIRKAPLEAQVAAVKAVLAAQDERIKQYLYQHQ